MRNEERWRFEVYRDRVRRSIADRFVLRFHISLILAAAILAGFGMDALLHAAGAKSLLGRYVVAILVAYGVFLVGVRVWLSYSGIAQYLTFRKAQLLVGDDVPPPEPWKPGESADEVVQVAANPEALFWTLGSVALGGVIFFAFGGYVLLIPESIFADIVLEAMLAAGLLRGVRRVERSGWLVSVWRNTWPSLAFSLAVAVAIGLYAKFKVPHATTLMELI